MSTTSAYQKACARMRSAPLELTSDDFAALEHVSPTLVETARQYQRAAEADRLRMKAADGTATTAALSPLRARKLREADAWAEAIVDTIKKALAPLRERLDAAERELKELKARPAAVKYCGVEYCGVWAEGKSYAEGNLVTRKGGLWCATGKRLGTPGSDGSGWLLIVKSGDAR